jgi:hypothetical protein
MVLHLPRVDFNYELIAGESFRVTFTIDRPAPAGGTLIEMRKFRDSGPIHTLPQLVIVPAGQTTAELIVGSDGASPRSSSPHPPTSSFCTCRSEWPPTSRPWGCACVKGASSRFHGLRARKRPIAAGSAARYLRTQCDGQQEAR